MGEVFTDQANGDWAAEDGLIKGAFLNVYVAFAIGQHPFSPRFNED